jgi:hypothetical protein
MSDLSGWTLIGIGAANAFSTAVFVTLGGGLAVLYFQSKEANRREKAAEERAKVDRELAEAHDNRQRLAAQEYQTRAALRESYARLLVVQRQSRESSMKLAEGSSEEDLEEQRRTADRAYSEFVNEYHRLALDADKQMWANLRMLEDTLKEMLAKAETGDAIRCEQLKTEAAKHRRALEDSFRRRLDHKPLHDDPDPAAARRR